MTKEEDMNKLKKLKKESGVNSKKYKDAFQEFSWKHGDPGRGISRPGVDTNGGSHGTDNDHFGEKKRPKNVDK